MPTAATAESCQSQEPETSSESPPWVIGPQHLRHLPLIFLGYKQGGGFKVDQSGHEPTPKWKPTYNHNYVTMLTQLYVF